MANFHKIFEAYIDLDHVIGIGSIRDHDDNYHEFHIHMTSGYKFSIRHKLDILKGERDILIALVTKEMDRE